MPYRNAYNETVEQLNDRRRVQQEARATEELLKRLQDEQRPDNPVRDTKKEKGRK
jgi:hypothetical protein